MVSVVKAKIDVPSCWLADDQLSITFLILQGEGTLAPLTLLRQETAGVLQQKFAVRPIIPFISVAARMFSDGDRISFYIC